MWFNNIQTNLTYLQVKGGEKIFIAFKMFISLIKCIVTYAFGEFCIFMENSYVYKGRSDFEKFIILTVNTFVFDLGNQLLCNYNDNFIVGNKMKNTLQTYQV